MRLNEDRPTIETSGELEEQFFSIKDQGMIFDILRNKMYSNPILAICREISCNARDAHREVGTPEVPIEIHLPNSLEPFYKIKDFGPGISPDRMSNIFIQYTASTKREDNLQTGGFGLGAKTPFSYSDTFTIVTNVNGMQYNYACFIDETKVGKLALFSSSTTTAPNGTEIIIPVKLVDTKHFIQWTEQSTRYWDVKPIIKGGNINYVETTTVIEGDKWSIGTVSNSWHREIKLIIDGIEYPLELSALRTYADSKMIDSARGNVYLYFDVGELSLSASREQVYLDKKTQDKIKDRLDSMAAEVKSRVVSKIESFDNLWLANVYYRQELTSAFSNIGFLGKLYWRGIPLVDHSVLTIDCPVFYFTKGKYSRKYGTDPNKISRQGSNKSLHFEENSELFINDLTIKEPTGRHVKKAFEDNPNLKNVQVICPNDKVTEDILNVKHNLASMKPRLLSEITKASSRKYTASTSRLLVFKVEPSNYNFRQVSFSSIDDDQNIKVLCQISKESYSYAGNRWAILKNGKSLNGSAFKTLMKTFPGVSFYGLDASAPQDRIDADFANFVNLEDFLKTKVIANTTINFVEIHFARNNQYIVDNRQLRNANKFKKLISDPDSLFLKRLDLHEKIKKLAQTDYGLLDIFESINGDITSKDLEDLVKNNPEYDIGAMDVKYNNKYPLIKHLNTYQYNDLVGDLSKYINYVDAD